MSPAEGASEPAPVVTLAAGERRKGPGLSKPRRKSKTAVADGSITGDELLRRRRQAELGAIAKRLRDSGQAYSSYRQRKQKYRNTDGSGATFVDKVEEKKAAAAAAIVAAAAKAAGGGEDEGGERSAKKSRVATKEEAGVPGGAPAKQLSKNFKGDKEPGWRPFNEVQVIVLPIFWNMHKEEKAGVMDAAEKVQAVLREGGISVDTDSSNKYTPGQKMKYWETMGVGVRIELGPKDAEAGRAVLALAGGIPGTVAQKSTFKVGPELLAAVTSALAATRRGQSGSRAVGGSAVSGGDDAAKGEDDERRKAKKDKKKEAKDKKRRLTLAGRDGTVMMRGSNAVAPGGEDGDEDGDGEGDEEQGGEHEEEWAGDGDDGAGGGADDEAAEEYEGADGGYEEEEKAAVPPHSSSNGLPHSSNSTQQKPAMGGGDDLEDDFDIDVNEPEEDRLTLSKDERKKKSRQVQKLRHKKDKIEARGGQPTSRSTGGDAEAEEQETVPESKKRKDASSRVVKF